MRFGTTTKATNWPERHSWKVRVVRALLWFIPRANPDNEALYPKVRLWAVEVDDDGKPNREVGVGEDGTPLFRSPEGRNFGFWTDSPMTFNDGDLQPILEREFEDLWNGAPPHAA
jgi:hypothetical protein